MNKCAPVKQKNTNFQIFSILQSSPLQLFVIMKLQKKFHFSFLPKNYFFILTSLLLAQKAAAQIVNCDCYNTTVKSVHTVQIVSEGVSNFADGPYWDKKHSLLYYVDVRLGVVKRLNVKTGLTEKIVISNNNETVTTIIPYADNPNEFIITKKNQILKLNWKTQETTVLATMPDPTGFRRFSGAKCDSKGRLYIGAFEEPVPPFATPRAGAMYRLSGERFDPLYDGFGLPSGMAFSPDEKLLYLNDYKAKRIYVFNYDKDTGELTHKRNLVSFKNDQKFLPTEGPDGMVFNKFGFIWISYGSKVLKIDPKLGCIADEVDLSSFARQSTSLAYGSYKGKVGFYVTTRIATLSVDKLKSSEGKILHIKFKGGRVYGFKP